MAEYRKAAMLEDVPAGHGNLGNLGTETEW